MGRAATKRVTEGEFTAQVIALAKLCGWTTAHFRPARTGAGGWRTAVQGDGKGFPDLVLVKPPRLVFAELKVRPNRLDPAQLLWLEKLMGVAGASPGLGYFVWFPEDWSDIERVLGFKRAS